MKKTASTAIASAFAIALTGTAAAQENTLTADECIWNEFNNIASTLNKHQDVAFTLTYEAGERENLVEYCEQQTGTESRTFKGMETLTVTLGNVTFEFK